MHCNDSITTDLHHVTKSSVPLTFISSILSVLGSLLIIATFWMWKDVRQSTARIILFFLAIADLGTGLAYFAAVIVYETNPEVTTKRSCRFQSFFTTFFPVVSFFWTSIMGVYFLVALVFRRPRWGPRILLIFNVIGWGVPFVFLSVMLGLGVLGPTIHNSTQLPVAGAWCFVSNTALFNLTASHFKYLIFEGLCGKFWEVLSFALVFVCYGLIVTSQNCKKQSTTYSSNNIVTRSSENNNAVNKALKSVEIKLMLIPFVFVLLRMWGVIRYIAAIVCRFDYNNNSDVCISESCYYIQHTFTVYLQAFCDPAQGFGNGILFVAFSNTIRGRLVRSMYILVYKLVNLFCRDDNLEDYENTPLLERKAVSSKPSLSNQSACSSSDESDSEIKYGSVNSMKI